MLPLTKPQTLSEMMSDIFSSYFPIIKNIYLFMLVGFVLTFIYPLSTIHHVISMIIYTVCMLKVNALLTQNSNLTGIEAFFFFLKRILPFTLMNLFIALCIAVFFILVSILSYAPLPFFMSEKSEFIEDISFYILSLDVVIALIFSVYSFFASFIFWLENKGIFQSIIESVKLTKRQFFYVMKLFLCFGLVFLPWFCMIGLVGFLGANPHSTTTSLPYANSFIIAAIETIYFPLMVSVPLFIYHNLRVRGVD